jgi:phosphoenolpyruvate phosphomutase
MEEFGDILNQVSWDERKIKIIARTEALIRGYGIAEAHKRVNHYKKCGADVVLPHTRNGDEILIPVKLEGDLSEVLWAIVPTKFPHICNQTLFDFGYNMVIWANQTERVKIKATRECLGSLKGSDSAEYIEANLSATLDDMKGLTNEL